MTNTTTGFTKDVQYDAITRDFCALVNGQILGWAKTLLQAEAICNEYVYEALKRGNVDAADLTPEDAADVLTALTSVENEAEQASYAAALEAEAQAAFEAEESRAGVPEARRVFVPNDNEPYAVRRVIDGMTFDANPEGLFISIPNDTMIDLDPLQAVALLTFLQSPNVTAIITQYERSMQNAQWLTFADESERLGHTRRWRPVDELPSGLQRMELVNTETMLRIAADAERRGVEQGTRQAVALLRQEMEKRAA